MCSNAKSGGSSVKVTAGNTSLFSQGATTFNSPQWYGAWVSHINYVYVDVTKPMAISHLVQADEDISIIITGTESSVYINSYTIEYEPGIEPTENALGYQYQKVDKKGTIADGDDILLYFAGMAAGNIDATQSYPYMDVYSVHDIMNVYEPELMYFKLRKNGSAWHLINQYGDTLGATAANKLAWNAGGKEWTIALTYDGAEIANVNSKYGTLRFSSPVGSYARMNTYTSNTLPLPYIYKRIKQNSPIEASSLTIAETLTLHLCQDTAILRSSILPKTTTNQRITWKSTNESVVSVRDGIVKPKSIGSADIVVFNSDSSLTDTCHVTITECPVLVESVTLDFTQLTLNRCGLETFTLKVNVLPENAAVKTVVWMSSNEAVATVVAGIVTAVAPGTATITARATEGNVSATCELTVEECSNGLKELTIVGVYSKKGKIVVEQTSPVDIAIYNLFGQLLSTYQQVQNVEIPLQQGIYLLKIGQSVMKIAVE